MEPVYRTSDNLRGLIAELDDKLGSSATRTTSGERIIDLRTNASATQHDEQPDADAKRSRRLSWGGLALVVLLVVGSALVVVQPWKDRCSYSTDICRIAALDIDALRVTLPNSDLIAQLPNIDALDPDDVLTAGDVFAMDRFADLDLEQLLSDDEVNQLLALID